MQYGDVFFTTSSETPEEVGMSSVWLENTENIYLNSFCFGYRPTKVFDPYFLAFYLRSPSVRTKITLLAQGISRYNISKTKLMEEEISFPTLPEQQKIGTLFRRLDRLITLHKRKWDDVILLKKALLQKMFPKNGSDFPTLRFPEFTDAWEKCKLVSDRNIKKIIDFRGLTPKKLGMSWSKQGYLALSALNVKNGFIDYSVEANYGNEELYQKWMSGNELQKGQVLFTTEAPMGNVAQVPDNKRYILSQRTIAFETNHQNLIDDFLAVLLTSPSIFKTLTSLSSGGTAKGISQKSLSELFVQLPGSIIEQQKIGALFRRLDRLITLHKRKLLEKYNKNNTKFLQNVTHQQSVLKLCCITFNPIIERTSLCN